MKKQTTNHRNPTIKVLIVDDHPIVREGLKQILAETPDLIVAGEASTAEEALTKVKNGDWSVVVLDISLPDRNGLDVLKQIKAQKPELPILILTMHDEEQYAMRVLKAGASGYVTKESAPEQLAEAIAKIAQGRKYVSPALAEKLIFNLGPDGHHVSHEILSDREFQVFGMIAAGKSVKEIGEELNLSIKTVSTHRARILQKMKMSKNAELIHYAIRNRLVN